MRGKAPLEITPNGVVRPRLDPYRRLLARFYEPLFLLKSLGQTRGEHTPQPTSFDASMERRRRFLQNLAYVCDFKKGGDSCTAIGLEDGPTRYQFWVASNAGNRKIVLFLSEALEVLRGASDLPTPDLPATVSAFIRSCADFADSRIKAEHKNVQKEAAICIAKLIQDSSRTAQELVEWLQEAVNYNDKIELCEFAYIHRNSVYIKQLAALASQDENGLDPAGRRSSFALVRHHILRLAHHIRAPTELVVDSYDLAHILHTYEVRGIDPFLGVPAPVRDSQTNLRGILNRMYRTTGEERKIVEDGLLYLDRTSNFMIFEHFMDQYEQSHPLVHAEVQVLELFHKGELSFAYGDRFVACSKPACLCCELYFKHHPARMVVPSSHRKVWTKWSPPLVKTFAKDDMVAREQTEIMNKIIQELRGQIIDQVLRRSQASRWHPDSKTCITETRSLGHFKSFGEQDIGDDSSSKSVANSLNTSESEAEVGVDQDVDSEDGGVCLFP